MCALCKQWKNKIIGSNNIQARFISFTVPYFDSMFFLPIYLLFRNNFNKFAIPLNCMHTSFLVQCSSQYRYTIIYIWILPFITVCKPILRFTLLEQFERIGSQIAINRQTHQHCYCGNTIGSIVWILEPNCSIHYWKCKRRIHCVRDHYNT